MNEPQLSIIIPALNEEEYLPATLARLGREDFIEIIVVDGGSSDRTREIAAEAGARVLTSLPGRARQMNAGADAAQAPLLLFLHSDTLVPPGFVTPLLRCSVRPDFLAASFCLAINEAGFGFRLLEQFIHFRAKVLQLPYGDQTLCLRKDIFQYMGGFPDQEFMEDFEFARRLRRRGRIRILKEKALTSARRWQKGGLFRTTLRNQLAIAGYLLGISAKRLRTWYQPSP